MITSTRTTTTVTSSDGRTVAVDEVGDPTGPAGVLLHSAPGSRHLDPDPAATAAAGIRLITLDRPGYGGSTPFAPDVVPSLAAQGDDVALVLDHLGIADAGVVGWSHGGRVAAAVAARHPARVRAIALVGTPSPDDLSWIPEEQQAMLDPLRADPLTATAALAGILEQAVGDGPGDGLDFVAGPADGALLAEEAVRARLTGMLAEAFAQGAIGCAADIVADQIAPWGFDAAAIGCPVHLVYSSDDFVRPHHGDWWEAQVVDPVRRTTRDVGHLLIVTEWADLLDSMR